MTLAGNLSDKVNTLTAEAEQIAQLREVTKPTAMSVTRLRYIAAFPPRSAYFSCAGPWLGVGLGSMSINSGLQYLTHKLN